MDQDLKGRTMDRRAFAQSFAALPIAAGLHAGRATSGDSAGFSPRAIGQTFSYAGKELRPFLKTAEATLAEQSGEGYLGHLWFGGDFPHYRSTRLRIYVDHEAVASIDCELGMAAGVGFDDPAAPWGTGWAGITGSPSGIYLNYRVPFSKHIRITAQLPEGVASDTVFWWIARGMLNRELEIGGVTLPRSARLRLHHQEHLRVQPLEFFDLCKVPGNGMLFQVFMAAQSTNFEFMEGQVRAYLSGQAEPMMLSSGLEDYFLGTYYFNRGLYHLPVAGLTHKDDANGTFSGYRYHDTDPVVFTGGLRLACRCGELLGKKVAGPTGKPQTTTYTTYVWAYEW